MARRRATPATRLALACALATTLMPLGCSEPPLPGPPLVLEPGDGLLDVLPLARWSVEPGPGVPPSFQVHARGGALVLRAPKMPPEAWRPVETVPPLWRAMLEENGNPNVWRAELSARLAEGSRPARIQVAGQDLPTWTLGSGPLPDSFTWYEHSLGILMSVGPTPPLDVEVDVPVDLAGELGELWPRGKSPSEYTDRRILDEISRPALVLPPPGVLEITVTDLRAERLHLSLGVLDRAWALFDDAFHRTRGLSDGATFAVEITRGGSTERIFERTVTADEVGGPWIDEVVDLSRWRGRPFVLRLVSEPGPSGDPSFDWMLWGDLRLRGGQTRRPERPHVVLLHVDTLRADRVGGEHSRTPQIDAWAAEHALVFQDALSPAPWTLPATVSMLTGLAVHQHEVERDGRTLGLGAQPLAERLRRAGYETFGLSSGGYLRPTFGFDQGFHRYATADPKNLNFEAVLEFAAQRDGNRPLFLFVHTYFVHAPYLFHPEHALPDYAGPLAGETVDYPNVIDPYRDGSLPLGSDDLAYVRSLYDGQVAVMDVAVGQLLEDLERELGHEGLVIVLTSDHGEAFAEHDIIGHGQDLWDELLSVPLIVRLPDGRPGVRTDPAALIDVVPTILAAVGLPPGDTLAGRSLTELQPRDRVRAARNSQSVLQQGVQVSGFKLLTTQSMGADEVRTQRLFQLELDPGEHQDLSASEPRMLELLQAREQAWLKANPQPEGDLSGSGDVNADVAEQLRALGYLGDG